MKKTILSLFSLCLVSAGASAQESVNSAGGDAIGSGGSVSYSIGQVAYQYVSSSSGSVSQGVQHSYDLITVGLDESNGSISLTAFPNPAADVLNLEIKGYEGENYTLQLLDAQGKLIRMQTVNTQMTAVPVADLPVASYFVSVFDQKKQKLKSFRIVKK